MELPEPHHAAHLQTGRRRLFIGAYGFEDRALGWVRHQQQGEPLLDQAIAVRYVHPKGRNARKILLEELTRLGVSDPTEVQYDVSAPQRFEDLLSKALSQLLHLVDEVVVDISAMTKLLILVSLCDLTDFGGTVRVVYSEAAEYAPTLAEYENSKQDMERIARFPSSGVESVIRTRCLSSIRMQGEPVTLVAFTSFNEQLVRHMLGTISPHRLLFINGRPPRHDFDWRERATQEIHARLIQDYPSDNGLDDDGLLARRASTLDYRETVSCLDRIYAKYGLHERIMCAATGSKMQTVGLFLAKLAHPDIHIEYPTPDSYFVKGMSRGVLQLHEVVFPSFAELAKQLRAASLPS